MSFDVSADAYARFMGRFSEPLAQRFAALAAPQPGQRALDVGCGPGALTARLADLLGAAAVTAVDPSESFVTAVQARLPGVAVEHAAAESLPFPDDSFDLTMAQLVVHFMSNPVRGLREMARVTAPGGSIAACVWDHAGRRGPLALFWQVVSEIDPGATDEAGLPGVRAGHLAALFRDAGLTQVESGDLTVRAHFASATEWWTTYTLGVGPAGAYVASLNDPRRTELERRCRARLPTGAFDVDASAWFAVARV